MVLRLPSLSSSVLTCYAERKNTMLSDEFGEVYVHGEEGILLIFHTSFPSLHRKELR